MVRRRRGGGLCNKHFYYEKSVCVFFMERNFYYEKTKKHFEKKNIFFRQGDMFYILLTCSARRLVVPLLRLVSRNRALLRARDTGSQVNSKFRETLCVIFFFFREKDFIKKMKVLYLKGHFLCKKSRLFFKVIKYL